MSQNYTKILIKFKFLFLIFIFFSTGTKSHATHIKKFFNIKDYYDVLMVGYGYNAFNYQKNSPSVIGFELKDEQVKNLYFYYEHRTRSDWGFNFSNMISPGSIIINNHTVLNPDYRFISWNLEGYSYHFLGKKSRFAFGPKFGLEHQKRPFLSSNSVGNIQVIPLTTISTYGGFFIDKQSRWWLWSLNLSYLYPIYTQAVIGDYEISDSNMFKASIEANYSVSQSLRIGYAWHGSYFQNSFNYNDGTPTNGNEVIVLSTVILNVSFIF